MRMEEVCSVCGKSVTEFVYFEDQNLMAVCYGCVEEAKGKQLFEGRIDMDPLTGVRIFSTKQEWPRWFPHSKPNPFGFKNAVATVIRADFRNKTWKRRRYAPVLRLYSSKS